MENINDFISFEKPSTEVIEKYTGKVPDQIIDLWKCYGFGSMLNGYLRAINPEKYLD
ncbi:GAD-like domain-containing protein, partial [Bacillus thuringiensis]